jgi:hypothetical protein
VRYVAIIALFSFCHTPNKFNEECCEELCKVARERDSLELIIKKYEKPLE